MLRDTDFVAVAPNTCYGALAVRGLGLAPAQVVEVASLCNRHHPTRRLPCFR